jgi:hypothetical protein
VPGLGALNKGDAGVDSVSCAAAGNCAAGGTYQDRHRNFQVFVAAEINGRWGRAVEVPGLGALNKGGSAANETSADVFSVSCVSPGNCAVGGDYWKRNLQSPAFVASLRHGRWSKAIEVPGVGALESDTWVSSVSCGSAGNCAAGGPGFADLEKNGVWGTAIEVPGLAALGGENAQVNSVSCASASKCAAGGYYTEKGGRSQGFVISEDNGTWGTPVPLPGLAALNTGGSAEAGSARCGPAGNCAAGRDFTGRSRRWRGFVTQAG